MLEVYDILRVSKRLLLVMRVVVVCPQDGFGGGSEVTENLGYNTCRESSGEKLHIPRLTRSDFDGL